MSNAALVEAREALGRHAWAEAFERLTAIDKEEPLGPEDLDRLGEAAWWLGQIDASIDARERAYAGYMENGKTAKAGRVSIRLAEDYFHRLSESVGSGWLSRAERLLEDQPETPEYAWLTRVRAVIAFEAKGELTEAMEWAKTAAELATSSGDRDLQALSLHDQGRVLVAAGETQEGMGLMEEAMVAAVAGDLGAEATGRIYCNMIDICEKLADYRRAGEWDEAARRWCERVGHDSGFPGICRVKRAEIMRLRGRWSEAENEAEKACSELSDFLDFAGVGFREIGEVRLRTGDLAGAEDAFRQANELGQSPQPGLALLRLTSGDLDGARQLIDRALADESLITLERAKLLPAKVEVALAADDFEAAESAASELRTIADDFGSIALHAAASHSEGALALHQGGLDDAIAKSEEAWRLWGEADLPYEAARARLQLGTAYGANGSDTLAGMEIDAARSAFERLGATLDLRRVQELGAETKLEPRRAVKAMMFTDIVGSTDLIDTIGDDAWTHLLAWHDRTLRSIFGAHEGREMEHSGDGFFVLFPSGPQAAEAAVEIQRTLQDHRTEAGFAPSVRIGVHVAEITETGETVTGLEVHKAARIGALATGGEIVVSAELGAELGDAVELSAPQQVSVKGIDEQVTVMRVAF
ncbi:MAG: adenylate/guanylate cyclase domain-containing protein [Acidimicrobiia bacterium]